MLNKVLQAKLDELMDRPNNRYTRGILHGFLLAMTTENRISNEEALAYMYTFAEKEEGM